MRRVGFLLAVTVAAILLAGGAGGADPSVGVVSGVAKKWHPIAVSFLGPTASENDASPNPFLDYRLQVRFIGPSGQVYQVPGFFDGDGNGGGSGDVWRARFTPDQEGTWSYEASFRAGSNVAVDAAPNAGTATSFDGASGKFEVAGRDPDAPGFLKWGLLEYAGGHYLKFRDGPHWLKGGADSPENLLGYAGFDNTPTARHSFSPHLQDWQAGDPVFNAGGPDDGKGLIGAVNYLAWRHVNSVYFLPMNVGGDAKDTSPFVGPIDWAGSPSNDDLRYDVSKLGQWETAFAHMQERGVHLHFVLNEAECPNKQELDDGTLGIERKLFYRELVARFGHHNALQWNVSEEYDVKCPLGAERVKEFAGHIQQVDPYDHPITVHQYGDPDTTWTPFLGDARFSLTSFQYVGSVAGRGAEVEEWRTKSKEAGRPLPVSMDELRSTSTTNTDAQRKEILWPTYLSGGHIEWYVGAEDQGLEDFRKYQAIWDHTWYVREFMEGNLPFWEMEPNDSLLTGESTSLGGGQVFAKVGEVYAVYLPEASAGGRLDLSSASGTFEKRWYNPRTGDFEGDALAVEGGGSVALGTPPGSPAEDWAVLLKTCAPSCPPAPTDSTPPTVTLKTPPDGAIYTLGQTVNADYACGDEAGGSGMASCAGPVQNGAPIDTSSPGSHAFTVVATDNAGNTGSVTHTYEVAGGGWCTITGTSAAETLTGTEGDDVICGLGGNDTLKGLGGNDTLKGEGGADKLFGGAGDDAFDGGLGVDAANFSGSAAGVTASLTDNTATGEGSDTLAGVENLLGSKYADTLSGSGGANQLLGGAAADALHGLDGADKLNGGGGNDTERGGLGNDSVVGSAGADSLFGEGGDDAVNSKDRVSGNDSLDGGAGTDTKVTDATEKSIVGFP